MCVFKELNSAYAVANDKFYKLSVDQLEFVKNYNIIYNITSGSTSGTTIGVSVIKLLTYELFSEVNAWENIIHDFMISSHCPK